MCALIVVNYRCINVYAYFSGNSNAIKQYSTEATAAIPEQRQVDTEEKQASTEQRQNETLKGKSEKKEFQAETRMLLDIVARSLYSDKEVSHNYSG